MQSVNIAELKNQLSACLHRVRAGEELVIRDRNIPIAKIIPLQDDDLEAHELPLVASGQMTLPKKPFPHDRFWAIGASLPKPRSLRFAIQKAIDADREETNAGILGYKRHPSHLRTRPGNRSR